MIMFTSGNVDNCTVNYVNNVIPYAHDVWDVHWRY